MQKLTKVILTVLSTLILTGCAICADNYRARTLKITYKTDLSGATLLQGDRYIGSTPVTLSHRLTEEQYQRGAIDLPAMAIHFASGAVVDIPAETILFADGLQYDFLYLRPQNAENIELDINMAQLQELKRNQELERQRIFEMQHQSCIMQQQLWEMQRQNFFVWGWSY